MKNILFCLIIVIQLLFAGLSLGASEIHHLSTLDSGYEIQWEKNYGSDPSYGARYEGPQPIGDCDNDGDNEVLIGGRDAMLRIMEWSDQLQLYEQTHTLYCPFYHI